MSARIAKQAFTIARAVARPTIVSARAIAPRWTAASASASGVKSFSSSSIRFGGGQTDAALSAKLAEELAYEQDSATAMAGREPEWLEEFTSNGVWKVSDKVGADEVTLERQFGNEKLKLTFSISDLDNPPDTSDLAVEDSPESTDTPDEPTFPVRASLNITKSGHPGALVMDLLVEDESFIIDNASFYPDRTLAEDLTAEGDWRRRGTYVGPRFDHLDEEVQSQFEQFLEEREVNANLAMFIPLYCEYKEQKEYVLWLGNVRKFIDV
ncbi:Mitochondrial acidic protein mam33 [Naganishia albida]|nr:Mitochondrial acidic protein mam33 [Naganishia albida]